MMNEEENNRNIPQQEIPPNTTTPAATSEKKKKQKKKKPQDVSLYELLEVNWDATPEEIKKAYYKRAKKLHPDKGGDPTQFHAMKRAYDILSDESKRATYDAYGLEMLKVIEGEAGPEVFLKILLKTKRFRALILLSAIFVVGWMDLFPILQAVRWDGAEWSWAIVFIPIWISLTLVYIVQLQLALAGPPAASSENEESAAPPGKPASIIEAIFATLFYSCCVCFFALLSVALDTSGVNIIDFQPSFSWYIVIIPWLVFEIVLVIHRLQGALQAVKDMKIQLEGVKAYSLRVLEELQGNLEAGEGMDAALSFLEANENLKSAEEELQNLRVSRGYLLSAFFWPIMRFITAFLLAGRASNSFEGTYFLTAIPIIFGVFVFPCLETGRMIYDAEEQPEQVSPRAFCCMTSLPYMFCLLIWLLGMAKLDNPQIYSGFAVWGPWFVISFFVFLQLTLFLCVDPEELLKDPNAPPPANGETAAKTNGDSESGAQAPDVQIPLPPSDTTTTTDADGSRPNVIILT